MTYYLDTSALAKIYHREQESELMRRMYDGGEGIQISELTRVEFWSLTVRRAREKNLQTSIDLILARFEQDINERFESFDFTSAVVEGAMEILSSIGPHMPLRTLDALHLSFYRCHCGPSAVFTSADKRLIEAAQRERVPVLNPLEEVR